MNTQPIANSDPIAAPSAMQRVSQSALGGLSTVSQWASTAYKNFQELSSPYIDKTGPLWKKKPSWKGRAKQVGVLGMALSVPLLPILTSTIMKSLGIAVKYLCIPVGPHSIYIIAGVAILILLSIISYLTVLALKKLLLKEPVKEAPAPFQHLIDDLIGGNRMEEVYRKLNRPRFPSLEMQPLPGTGTGSTGRPPG